MQQISERDTGEHFVDPPLEQSPNGANAARSARIAPLVIDAVQIAIHLERHVLRGFDDVLHANGLREPTEEISTAGAPYGVDQASAPQAQQNLFDVVMREAFLLGELACRDRALPCAAC